MASKLRRAVRLRPLLLLALAASALVLAGCGNKVEVRTVAETEGIYIDVGELKYQVQLSRIINPNDVEDRCLPAGPAGRDRAARARRGVVRRLDARREHDGRTDADVRRRVRDRRHAGAHLQADPARGHNPFAYEAQELKPQTVLPSSDSPAGEGVIQGSLILFKVTTEALANRPLEFKIQSPALPDDVGIVDLDV